MLGWSINLFRIRGIQLALHFSFVLWLAYDAWNGYQVNGTSGMIWSSAEMIAFFTCVVLHELGHSFTAMHFGVGVRRILLMPIGGMAEFDSIPREPKKELLITAAGPAVNFVIAAVLWLIVGFPYGLDLVATPESASELFRNLAVWNLGMGIFNLVPVFPMDGGRIFRALLATRLSYLRATFWAANVGKVLAGIAIAYALWNQAYLVAALFAFIFSAGTNEYRSLKRREQYEAQWRTTMEVYATPVPPGPKDEPPLLQR